MAQQLPPLRHNKTIGNLRWVFLTTYHRLCLLVLVPNVLAIVALAAGHNLFKIPLAKLSTAVAANTAAAILIRQELVINLLYSLVATCPRTAPLWFRRHLAKIYHLGGVHSGAGIAATAWFTLFNGLLIRDWKTGAVPGFSGLKIPLYIIILTSCIDALLVAIIVFAHPGVRRRHHNVFETVHRFAGWVAILLFWVLHILFTDLVEKSQPSPRPLAAALTHSPTLYLLLLITISLILPWLRLRLVRVHAEHLSAHATRLHFRHTNAALCTATRISDSPLKEWHSFATIPERNGTGFSVIVSAAGDWTRKMIANPPHHLWMRGIPTRGVLFTAPLFTRLVIVATGSGIGPVLSLISARDIRCRILWSARRPQHTYGDAIVDEVFTADPAALFFDTSIATAGQRPDLVRWAYTLYRTSGAEAVFVISNQAVTEELVRELEPRGVPIFAPIFDS